MLDLQPHDLAGAQAAAIAEAEQDAHLQTTGYGEQPAHLIRAHHLRNLLGLAKVIDLGGQIEPPQRHAKQEPHPGHDAVAVANAHAALGQVQLKETHVLACRGVR
jgi:hypothetical protein